MALTGSTRLSIGAALLLGSGCAVSSYSSNDQVGLRRTASVRDVITREDILDRAPTALNAYEAVQRLRSTWLRPVGTTSFLGSTFPQAYQDNIRQVDLDALRNISITLVEEIRYYTATEATMQWGTGHTGGAIEVISDARRTRRTVATGDEDRRPGEPTPASAPYERFRVVPVLHFNGASSVVSAPAEIGDFWSPSYALGGGFGITATRTVTLTASVDYNRYSFEEGRLLAFLESATGLFRLHSRENAEVRGAPLTLMNVYVGMKAHPDWPTVVPYLTGGVGYLRMVAGAFSVTGPGGADLAREDFGPGRADGGGARENSFSVGVGGGLDFRIGRNFTFFVDGRYVIGFRGPRYSDITGDLQLFNTQYFPFRFGMTYRLAHLRIAEY